MCNWHLKSGVLVRTLNLHFNFQLFFQKVHMTYNNQTVSLLELEILILFEFNSKGET